jgi:D-glycero-alpha-D-manno-heptose 1-phosphate guanylyltransferase
MIRKAVILAGGKGTRLASVVHDKPKPMAEIAGLPFLHYMILTLKKNGIEEVVLLVGHLREVIIDYFQSSYHGVVISYEIEAEPRGTGGLIYELAKQWQEPILLINGDTYFDVDIQALVAKAEQSEIIIAVRAVEHSDRYGVLEINDDRIVDFKEKTWIDQGYINGGIYMLPAGVFNDFDLPFSFSLEKDFFEAYKDNLHIKPYYSHGYFIDIGIPDDYEKAQTTIPGQLLPKMDTSWTLFLDRDGVINTHRPDDYVKNETEFEWIAGSKEAIRDLSQIVGRVLVVTNQQGIGKGMMTEYDLDKINWKMQTELEAIGGRIDRVYYCPHLAAINPKCRKPDIGMAEEAQQDFPEISFSKSIMIGDSDSDIEFGCRLGMFTVRVSGASTSKGEMLRVNCLAEFGELVFPLSD